MIYLNSLIEQDWRIYNWRGVHWVISATINILQSEKISNFKVSALPWVTLFFFYIFQGNKTAVKHSLKRYRHPNQRNCSTSRIKASLFNDVRPATRSVFYLLFFSLLFHAYLGSMCILYIPLSRNVISHNSDLPSKQACERGWLCTSRAGSIWKSALFGANQNTQLDQPVKPGLVIEARHALKLIVL